MAYTDGGEWVGVSRIGPDASADPLERLVAAVESIDRRLGALEDRHRADVEADAGLRDRIERVADQVSDLAKGVDALGERVDRSSDAVQAGTDALSELSANASSTRDALRTLRQATATESSANRDGFVEVRDQVAEIDRRIVSRAQMDDVRQRIEQAERSLAHQANVIGEAIRSRVDDQRVLSRELAAQISALNAAVSTSEPSSELVRRDVQSTVEVLAERVAHAMGELRSDFREAQSRQARALASSDTTRVDASQLSSTLRSVQDSTDERLRRIDGQLSELRNSLDLLRWGGGRRDHRDGDDAGRASRSDVDAASVIDPADHGTGDSWTGDPGDVGHHDVDAGDGDDRDLDRRDLEGRDLEGRDLDAPVDDHDHDHDDDDDDDDKQQQTTNNNKPQTTTTS